MAHPKDFCWCGGSDVRFKCCPCCTEDAIHEVDLDDHCLPCDTANCSGNERTT